MSSPTFTVAGGPTVEIDEVANTLRAEIDTVPPGQPQVARQELVGGASSEWVVVIRGHETSHIHPHADLLVFVLEGGGYVQLADCRIDSPAGSIALIPQGACHGVHNESAGDSVLFGTFVPDDPTAVSPCPPGT